MGKDLKGKELGEGLSQRKDGQYQARFTNKFGKRESFYSRNLKELKEQFEIEKAKNKLNKNVIDRTTTLDDWFIKWIDIHKYGVIRPNTERQYKQIYLKHISPVLGKQRLCEITQLQVKALINDLDRAGFNYATKNRVRIMLLDMFGKALIDDFVPKNPVKGIKVIRDEETEPRYLTPEEQKLFFDCCKGTFYDNMFTVALNSGLRPGEIYALKEDDLDFEKKTIRVDETLIYQKLEGDQQKTFHFGPPKTKASYRTIQMTRACETALKKQLLQNQIIRSKTPKEIEEQFKTLVFTTKYGTPINAQIECEAIKSIIDNINLIRDDLEQIEMFSGHTFRHTFASNCYRNGFSIKVIQKLLGHSSATTTERLYIHVFKEELDESMDKLSDAMEKLEQADNTEILDEQFSKMFTEKTRKIIKFA